MVVMTKVKIYTTSTCAYCRAEKAFFDAKGVKYEEAHADTDVEAAKEMIAISGQMGVPFTVITHDDGHQVGILGFDQPRLSAELGLK